MAPVAAKLLMGLEKIKEVKKLKLYVIYGMVPFAMTLSDRFHKAQLRHLGLRPSENPGPTHVPTVPMR